MDQNGTSAKEARMGRGKNEPKTGRILALIVLSGVILLLILSELALWYTLAEAETKIEELVYNIYHIVLN